ncbi:MAG: acyl carrier protein [Clostridia bacterium]|nr:acyl carrier protein [Clostridia bacterium]
MFDSVRQALAKQLRVPAENITPASRIKEDLGADSLDVLQLLMTIEEELGITIPDEALAEFRTVSDIVTYLEDHR